MAPLLSRTPLMRGVALKPVAARPPMPARLVKTGVVSPMRAPMTSAPKPAVRFAPVKPVEVSRPEVAAKAASGSSEPAKESTFLGYSAFTWSKIIPLGLMFFCILFNYTILRDTKDVLVVTAPGSGAEIIPFLKTWVNLPMAIVFTIGYAKLANVLSPEALFYVCVIPFIIFFGFFATVMYPMQTYLHPTEYCKDLLLSAGERWAGPIAILRNWTYCLFYVMAELWGSVVVSVCFWGFANQITTVEEAEGFYPLFGLGANVALIFSGQAVKYFSEVRANLPPGVDGWGVSLNGMMGMVVIGGILVCAIYWALQRFVVPKLPGLREKKKTRGPHRWWHRPSLLAR
jgi:AAA family ATP:ADP antiporter